MNTAVAPPTISLSQSARAHRAEELNMRRDTSGRNHARSPQLCRCIRWSSSTKRAPRLDPTPPGRS
eukprot:4494766-Heterocapsa_arctica.AAC.1